MLEPLSHQEAEDAQLRYYLAGCLASAAQMHEWQEERKEALRAQQAALACYEKLVQDAPTDGRYRQDRFWTLHTIGLLQDDAAEGLGWLEKAHDLAVNLARDAPTNFIPARLIACNDSQVALALLRKGEADAALKRAQDACNKFEQMRKNYPPDFHYPGDRADSYWALGEAQNALGLRTEALRSWKEACKVYETLPRIRVRDKMYYERLGQSYACLGTAHWAAGDRAEALRYWQQAQTVREDLATAFPENPRLRRDLLATYEALAKLCQEMGQANEAERYVAQTRGLRQ